MIKFVNGTEDLLKQIHANKGQKSYCKISKIFIRLNNNI